jgi:hypothetical protein
MKSLLILKILAENLFIMLVAAYRKPPVAEICFINYPLHVYLGGFFLHQMRGDNGRKSTNDRVRKPDRNFDAAFGENVNFPVESVFLEVSKFFNIWFSLLQG